MRNARYWVPSFKTYVLRKRLYFRLKRMMDSDFNHRNKIFNIDSYSCPKTIPKIIWMYWKQGENNAPELVKHCLKSWRKLNPDWDIRVLDDDTAKQYTGQLTLPPGITVQAYSDILRVNLLAQYGGVWADATCYCARPLDYWLPALTQSGFFAFANPHPDRIISSWFLASEQNGTVIRTWKSAVDEYWKNTTKADHYLWLHYLFEYLTKHDKTIANLWEHTPKISADGPHILKRALTTNGDVSRLGDTIALDAIPVFKLTWKDDIPIGALDQLGRSRPRAAPIVPPSTVPAA